MLCTGNYYTSLHVCTNTTRDHLVLQHVLYTSVFLTSLYGTPLVHIASYLALHSSLFGPVAQVIMIIVSLTAVTLS